MSHIHTAMTSSVLPTPQYTSRYLENIPTPPAFPQRLSACRAASGSVGL